MKAIHLFDNAEEAIAIEAGTTLFAENSFADLLYVLIAGEVTIVREDCEIATVGAGGLIGEMAIVENRPHYASAIAKTDCKLVPVDRHRFRFLIEQTPNFAFSVLEIMAERLHQMDRQACTPASVLDATALNVKQL